MAKKDLHPKNNDQVKVICSCGATFTTTSTLAGPVNVEVCSSCHPFYTGVEKLVDTEGRVEKFQRKEQTAQKARLEAAKRTEKKKETLQRQQNGPLTLKDMLKQAQGKNS